MSNTPGRSFITTYNGLSNVLKNDVSISNINEKNPPNEKWKSLWDTGATNTVITPNVVKKLNLKPVSVKEAATPQGRYKAYVYYINLYLPNGVIFPNLLVMEGQPAGCDILIGMDVIGKGDFAVSNYQGKTTFSYRFPSMATIDFVNNSYLKPITYRDAENGVSKNSKCPCGSGKKYKQCCGKGNFN